MTFSADFEQLQAIHQKVESIAHTTQNNTKNQIHLDLAQDLSKQLHTLISCISNKATTLSTTYTNQINELNKVISEKKSTSDKNEIKEINLQIKNTKNELSTLKKETHALKIQYKDLDKELNSKIKNLKKEIDATKKTAEKAQEQLKKIEMQRQNIEYLKFLSLQDNHKNTQNKLISDNANFKVFNTSIKLSEELTHALSLNSFGAIIDEISYLTGTPSKKILIINKGGLKFEYNTEVNDTLRMLGGSYNKFQKSWWILINQLDKNTTENLHSYLSSVFDLVVDLDNILLYTINTIEIMEYLEHRYNQPKLKLLNTTITINKGFIDSTKCHHEAISTIFKNERGVSIYNPTKSTFEAFKKSSEIQTKIPILFIRATSLNDYVYYLLNLRDLSIANPDSISDYTKTRFHYRTQLTDINENDFSS